MKASINATGQSHLKGAVAAVAGITALTLIGKALGFGEKIALAYYAGTSGDVDAYFVAVSTSFCLYILVDDILAPVFMTHFVEIQESQGHHEAREFLRRVVVLTFLALLLLLAGIISYPAAVISLIAPGFSSEVAMRASELLRWTSVGGVFFGLSSLTYLALNARGKFLWPASAAAASKAVTLLGILLLFPILGLTGAAIAMAGAGVAQFILHAMVLIKIPDHGSRDGAEEEPTVERRLVPPMAPKRNHATRMAWKMLPLAIGTLAAQLSGLVVDSRVGSNLGEGTISSIAYARRLIDLPLLTIVAAIATVVFPLLAKLASLEKSRDFSVTLWTAIRLCCFVLAPIAAFAFFKSDLLVDLVYSRGAFDREAAAMTARVLAFFALGLIGFGLDPILLRIFYSVGDTVTPIVVGLVCVAINIALTLTLAPIIGPIAIPLALSIQKTLKSLVLILILATRYGHPNGFRVWASLLRFLFSTLLFCGAVELLTFIYDYERSFEVKAVMLGAITVLSGIVYVVASIASGVIGMDEIRRMMKASR